MPVVNVPGVGRVNFPDGMSEAQMSAEIEKLAPSAQPATDEAETPSLGGAATFAGMKAVPGIVSGVNMGAKLIGAGAKSRMGRYAPGIIALDAAGDVLRGDLKGAATSATGAAAMTQVPRIAAAVQRATAPTSGVTNGVKWAMKPGMGAGVTRLGGLLSRLSGPVSLGVETIFGDGAAGHRPAGETPETTAARQSEFEGQANALFFEELMKRLGGGRRAGDINLP